MFEEMSVDGGRITLQPSGDATRPVGFASIDWQGDATAFDFTSSEARALAALLLKHADRAEGKTS